MAVVALDYVRERVVAERPRATLSTKGVGHILEQPQLNQELRERLRRTGDEYRLSPDLAQHMADELLVTLLSLEAEDSPQRTINAWLDGLPPSRPLAVDQTYALCFNIAPPRHDALATGPAMDPIVATLPPDQEQVAVTVLLSSDSIEIGEPRQQTLMVPRSGPSEHVEFTIRAPREGTCQLDAYFFIESQLFYQIKLQLKVGERADGDTVRVHPGGRELEAALHRLPRRKTISLLISKRSSGYELILMSETGVKRANMRISEAEIDDMLCRARKTLSSIVSATDHEGRLVYQQQDTGISQELGRQAIKQLAEVGSYLYSKLFYGRDDDTRAIGELLRALIQSQQFSIDIISEHFVFPWTLLYIGEDLSAPEPHLFWGFQHLVAYMPQFSQATQRQLEPEIVIENHLRLGFVYNQLIDRHQQVVSRQRQFFQSLPRVLVSEYMGRQHLFKLLGRGAPELHIIYFYCHAASHLPNEKEGVSSSRLILTDGSLELHELEANAPLTLPPLASAPLVFLNACESAELSPYLYDGLLPYLIKRGARGVIGTEVDTPVYFAAEFARRLFAKWIAGESRLGEVVLQLRRKYLYEHNNVLGLLYSMYVSSDLMIVWSGTDETR